jgi:hypothetical protein
VIGEDSEQIHIKVVANFLISFGAHINIWFLVKAKIHVLI